MVSTIHLGIFETKRPVALRGEEVHGDRSEDRVGRKGEGWSGRDESGTCSDAGGHH